MKKTNFLQIVCFLVIGLFSTNLCFAQENPKGYEPPTSIPDEEAFGYANHFKTVHGQNGTPISGGVITREALDLILKTSNCNAVTYKFGIDPSGKIAPANSIFVILSGANVTETNGVLTVTEIGATKYRGNDWCPPNCMKFMVNDPGTNQIRPVE